MGAIVPCGERAIEFSNVVAYDQVDDLLRLRALPPTSEPDHIAISHERVVQVRAKPLIVAHTQNRTSAAMLLLLLVPDAVARLLRPGSLSAARSAERQGLRDGGRTHCRRRS